MTDGAAAEEAIVTISEKIQGMERMERHVEALLNQVSVGNVDGGQA